MGKISIRQLAKTVGDETTRPADVVEDILWATFNTLAQALANGDEFTLTNFGKLSTCERPARKGRNPQTGGTVHIPATMVATFKANGALREMVRDSDTCRTIYKPNTKRGGQNS